MTNFSLMLPLFDYCEQTAQFFFANLLSSFTYVLQIVRGAPASTNTVRLLTEELEWETLGKAVKGIRLPVFIN